VADAGADRCGRVVIREATEQDVPSLVSIQQAALPDAILSRLGERFLSNVVFPAMLTCEGFTFVHVEAGTVDAFVVFSRDSDALTARFTSRKVSLVAYSAWAVLRTPAFAGDILAYVRKHRLRLTTCLDVDFDDFPELYVIAATPERQSIGIGSRLVRHGLDRLAKDGQPRCLVKAASPRASEFYGRLGFDPIGVETRGSTHLQVLLSSPREAEESQ